MSGSAPAAAAGADPEAGAVEAAAAGVDPEAGAGEGAGVEVASPLRFGGIVRCRRRLKQKSIHARALSRELNGDLATRSPPRSPAH